MQPRHTKLLFKLDTSAFGVFAIRYSIFVALFLILPSAGAETGKPLSKEKIPDLETAALNGSGRAAMQLANHNAIVENDAEGKYWFRIAVENGDPEAVQSYAARLWMGGGKRNCARALHLYDDLLATPSHPVDAKLLAEVRAQSEQMKKEIKACVTRSCSKTVDGSWCGE